MPGSKVLLSAIFISCDHWYGRINLPQIGIAHILCIATRSRSRFPRDSDAPVSFSQPHWKRLFPSPVVANDSIYQPAQLPIVREINFSARSIPHIVLSKRFSALFNREINSLRLARDTRDLNLPRLNTMSLKRKASVPSLTSSNPAPVLSRPSFVADDSPKHLHSRTRKRFRNDRPDDEVVYGMCPGRVHLYNLRAIVSHGVENTMRWLFTAQQQQQHQAPTPSIDEDEATEPEPVPSSEIVDPRQQTLLKFFRPSQSTPSHIRMNKLDQQSNHVIPLQTTTFQSPNFNLSSPVTSTGWSTSSPPSQLTGSDMDMDSITNESVQEPRRPPGGCGWA